MQLPFIELDAVWHMGDPTTIGSRPTKRQVTKNWDYEFGLFSVSLEPEVWRAGWAGPEGDTYELRAHDRKLRFVDADRALSQLRASIEAAALRRKFISSHLGDYLPTACLYSFLDLTPCSQLPLEGRPFEDQALQAALAGLAHVDQSIDGLWWSDTLGGAMRSERGGIYQDRLSEMNVTRGSIAPAAISPLATHSDSNILD